MKHIAHQGGGVDPWTAGRACTVEPEIDPTAIVRNSAFGQYTYIGADCVIAETTMGDYGYAMGGNQIAHAEIGKFSNIATGVRINPSNHPWWRSTLHHFTYRSRSYGFDADDDTAIFNWRREDKVTIGPDVWFGHNAIVMPGVTIGAGAVIGSGTIVTKDVPAYAVVVGVAARVIRFRAEPDVIERMQRLAWWDWSHAQIDGALPDIRKLDIAAFAAKYG